jgi:RNA polymerase sigma factor (sigma-70 family)
MTLAYENDKELIEGSRQGDSVAFAGIVARYQSLVCAVTYNGTGDLALSEDLAQETFLAAWRDLASLRDATKLRAWLCGIARNLTRDHVRRERRDLSHGAQALDMAGGAAVDEPSPREALARTERETLMWGALAEIPETYRLPLILYYREGHSVRAMAEALELSEETARQRLSRGRRALKDQVARMVEDTLEETQPSEAFTARVLAAAPGVAKPAAAGAGAMGTVIGAGLLASVGGVFVGILGGLAAAWMSLTEATSLRRRRYALKRVCLMYGYIVGFLGVQGAIGLSLWRTPHVMMRVSAVAWALYFVGILGFVVIGFRGYRRVMELDKSRGAPAEDSALEPEYARGRVWLAYGVSACVAAVGYVLTVLCGTAAGWMPLSAAIVAAVAAHAGFTAIFVWGLRARVREEAAAEDFVLDPSTLSPNTRANIKRGYAGMVGGPLAWALVWALVARDWAGAALLVGACSIAWLLCARAISMTPWRHSLTGAATCAAMACFAGPFIAIKWPYWIEVFGGRLDPMIARAGGFIFGGIYGVMAVIFLMIGYLIHRRGEGNEKCKMRN